MNALMLFLNCRHLFKTRHTMSLKSGYLNTSLMGEGDEGTFALVLKMSFTTVKER